MPILSSGASEFITVPLAVIDCNGPVPHDALQVDIALVPDRAVPADADWHAAVWDEHGASYLVDAAQFSLGWHDAWIRVRTGVETTIRRVRPGLLIQATA